MGDAPRGARVEPVRKVVVQQFFTIDGFAAGPNGELDVVSVRYRSTGA
jgi:hypothetical protein